MSRKRANSLCVTAPQPSTILVAMLWAASVSCARSLACPLRPKSRASRSIAIESACARCHARMCRKSRMRQHREPTSISAYRDRARASLSLLTLTALLTAFRWPLSARRWAHLNRSLLPPPSPSRKVPPSYATWSLQPSPSLRVPTSRTRWPTGTPPGPSSPSTACRELPLSDSR